MSNIDIFEMTFPSQSLVLIAEDATFTVGIIEIWNIVFQDVPSIDCSVSLPSSFKTVKFCSFEFFPIVEMFQLGNPVEIRFLKGFKFLDLVSLCG